MLCPKRKRMVVAGFSLREKPVGAQHAEPKNQKTVGATLAVARLGHGGAVPLQRKPFWYSISHPLFDLSK